MRDSAKKQTVIMKGALLCRQKSKLNAEEKVEIIRKYQQGEISLAQAAREASVETATIYRWSTRYEAEGAGGIFIISEEPRLSIRTKVKGGTGNTCPGLAVSEKSAKKYKLRNERQLSNWIKVYHAHGDFNSVKFSGGGSYMKQGRDTTQEERVQIVKDCLASGKKLRRDGLEVQGELPAGTHMDAAVRGDGRGRSGGSARETEEGPSTQN